MIPRLLRILLALVLGGCGWVLGAGEADPVAGPEFRALRIDGGRSLFDEPFLDAGWCTVWIHRDGRTDGRYGIDLYAPPEPPGPGQLVSKIDDHPDVDPLKGYLWDQAEMWRLEEFPDPKPAARSVQLIPDARTRWSDVRPVLRFAVDGDVRMVRGGLVGIEEGKRVALHVPVRFVRRDRWSHNWSTWEGDEAKREIDLLPTARDGVDAAAVAARVAEGPVALFVADEVPAQVVADVAGALHAAGADPVLLAPDPPRPGGEQSLPGVVIR